MKETFPKVIYEDRWLMVIDKPPGWIVNASDTTSNQPVLQHWLEGNINYPISKNDGLRSGIVHRLDKNTSGVIVVAKTEDAFYKLQDLFKERKVQKRYVALLHGDLEIEEGNIDVPVGRLPWNRRKFGVIPGGRESTTDYKVLGNYSKDNENFTLTEFYPKTGRTHQIRIHAKYLNHPLVSDDYYSGRKTYKRDIKWCPRIFLHAENISFTHPYTEGKLSITSKIPPDLSNALNSLNKIE